MDPSISYRLIINYCDGPGHYPSDNTIQIVIFCCLVFRFIDF